MKGVWLQNENEKIFLKRCVMKLDILNQDTRACHGIWGLFAHYQTLTAPSNEQHFMGFELTAFIEINLGFVFFGTLVFFPGREGRFPHVDAMRNKELISDGLRLGLHIAPTWYTNQFCFQATTVCLNFAVIWAYYILLCTPFKYCQNQIPFLGHY